MLTEVPSRFESGTSFAAPLVSFTAALLSADGLSGPQIKWRIMSSTDLDPSLDELLTWKGRLNLAKALAINHDVVEMRYSRPGASSVTDPRPPA
jgi:subtilisin family serine protease